MSFFHRHIRTIRSQAGFSIVEMMVSISIIVLLASVMLAKYTQFDSETILTNLAYDVSLSVREAQVYGLGVRAGNDGGFDSSYGMHFATGNSQYFLYADRNNNGTYESSTDQVITTYNLNGSKYEISAMTINSGTVVTSLDISFRRPNPDARICGGSCGGTFASQARITLRSIRGNTTRTIYVANTGQISVQGAADGL